MDVVRSHSASPPDRASLGRLLKDTRLARRFSQAVLAKSAGVSAVFISQIESGQRIPSDRVAKRIADALGLPWQHVLQEIYRLRSHEGGGLFSELEETREPGWRSVTEMPSIRMLLLQLASLKLPPAELEMLLNNWCHQVDFLKTQLRKASNK